MLSLIACPEGWMGDVLGFEPQTHVSQLEGTIRSAHALLQAGLISDATNLLGAYTNDMIPTQSVVHIKPPCFVNMRGSFASS